MAVILYDQYNGNCIILPLDTIYDRVWLLFPNYLLVLAMMVI